MCSAGNIGHHYRRPQLWSGQWFGQPAALRAEISRLRPAEVLHAEGYSLPPGAPGHATPWTAWRFEPGRCQEALLSHFEVAGLDAFGLRGQPLAARAAGAVLQYIKETRPDALNLLTGLSTYSFSSTRNVNIFSR